jgi:hypothetical protein
MERKPKRAGMPEVITIRMVDPVQLRRMTEAARLLRSLTADPGEVEMEVESGSNYGRVSYVTGDLYFPGRDLETFQRALSLATELVICSLEDDTFVLELSFPGVFMQREVRYEG